MHISGRYYCVRIQSYVFFFMNSLIFMISMKWLLRRVTEDIPELDG